MKRSELVNLFSTLKKVSHIKNTKFAYAIMKNMKKLEPEVEIIRNLATPTLQDQAYEQERITICKNMAEKDENDNPIVENGGYKITNMDSFNKKWDKLKNKYKETLKDKEKREKEMIELLDEEIEDINLHKIKLENCPDDLDAGLLIKLDLIIDE